MSIHQDKTSYNTCDNKFLQKIFILSTAQEFFGSTLYMYPAF